MKPNILENEVLSDDLPIAEIERKIREVSLVSKKGKIILGLIEVIKRELKKQDENFNSNDLFTNVISKETELRKVLDLISKQEDGEDTGDASCVDSKNIYILETEISKTAKKEFRKTVNDDNIRHFPWNLFEKIPVDQFQKKVSLIEGVEIWTLKEFLGKNAQRKSTKRDYFFKNQASENNHIIGFVLIKVDTKASDNDLKAVKCMNYSFATNLFFNISGDNQIFFGKQFELVYIYLTYIMNVLKQRKLSDMYENIYSDIEYTLDVLSSDKSNSLCKMPFLPIYYSINVFKKILRESNVFEKMMDPFKTFTIRRVLNLKSDIYADDILLFVGCLEWMLKGQCPRKFKDKKMLNDKQFKEIMKFKPPKSPIEHPMIYKMLLKNFIKSVELGSEGQCLFINTQLPEREIYYKNVPSNFMKFLILNLNYGYIKFASFLKDYEIISKSELDGSAKTVNKTERKIKKKNPKRKQEKVNKKKREKKSVIEGKVHKNRNRPPKSEKGSSNKKKHHKNIDINLISAYKASKDYDVNFDKMLYTKSLSSKSEILVCWSTLRPKGFFKKQTIIWSEYIENFDKNKEHKQRLQECDSLHTSLYNQYLAYFTQHKKAMDKNEFLLYLAKKHGFKTFEENIIGDVEDVVETYANIMSHYGHDLDVIKKQINESKVLEARKTMEKNCKIDKCFHQKPSSLMRAQNYITSFFK